MSDSSIGTMPVKIGYDPVEYASSVESLRELVNAIRHIALNETQGRTREDLTFLANQAHGIMLRFKRLEPAR